MSPVSNDRRIDYIEFSASDIERAKAFYSSVFGWKFTDYGPEYTSFEDGRMTGGFSQVAAGGLSGAGTPLIVIYATDLAAVERAVVRGGGVIGEHIQFPGGKRFHFTDPVGNRLAVWSDAGVQREG
ncbi:MAG TPA: VOC family protein [Gemmatimonadales bacterium]|jgi:predicted enzyme related to lactoylglutathione lyase